MINSNQEKKKAQRKKQKRLLHTDFHGFGLSSLCVLLHGLGLLEFLLVLLLVGSNVIAKLVI